MTPDMPEQQKEKYVKVALNKAERLEKLINELFEITKYNAHTVIIKKENIDLHCLIAQVIDEIYRHSLQMATRRYLPQRTTYL